MSRKRTPFPAGWPEECDWSAALSDSFHSESFESLQRFLCEERERATVYPPQQNVFEAFRLTPLRATKVVILGQDPYHGPRQAHGLSFSVLEGCPLPPSLRNIFKELASDLGIPIPPHGNLTRWAEQGVLLLNTVMTVREGAANSHAQKGWEEFTDQVIARLGQQTQQPLVFLLWGKPAARKRLLIDDRHAILISAHPSPLSAHRGFFGSVPFSMTNERLIEFGTTPIDWRIS